MKKICSLLLLLFFLFQIQAQTTKMPVQGAQRDVSSLPSTKSIISPKRVTVYDTNFTFDQILNWTGKGTKRAAMVVQWNDGKQSDAMVWGYCWEGKKTVTDMIKEITKSDPRFFLLIKENSVEGTLIGGIGYDLMQNGRIKLYSGNHEEKGVERVFTTNLHDFEKWKTNNNENHWAAGWSKTFWLYYIRESSSADFTESLTPASEHELSDGSWCGWSHSKVNHSQPDFFDKFTAAQSVDYTKGVFFLNEESYDKSKGSINYLNPNGEFSYDVFRRENKVGKNFGVTSQFGTIFDGKLFVISKENRRIVVADAITLKELATLYRIMSPYGRSADGRAFLGITKELGYISTSNGICTFNLKDYSIGDFIPGTEGETGNMIRTEKYIFAVQSKRVLILKDNTVVSTISGCNYSSICQSKDGMVWIAAGATLIKVNPKTLEIDTKMLPEKAGISNFWGGAWNAGSFCAATQRNAIYWISSSKFSLGRSVYCYEIDNPLSLMSPIFTLPQGKMFYGAGIRVHPATDLLYLTTTNDSYSDFDQNWVHVVNASSGAKIEELELISYFWFPAMPIFPELKLPSKYQSHSEIINNINGTVEHVFEPHKRAYRSGDCLFNLPAGAVVEAYNSSGALCFKMKANHSELKIPRKGLFVFNVISDEGVQVVK